MSTNNKTYRLVKSDNFDNVVMSNYDYQKEVLNMSTGDFHTHVSAPISLNEAIQGEYELYGELAYKRLSTYL